MQIKQDHHLKNKEPLDDNTVSDSVWCDHKTARGATYVDSDQEYENKVEEAPSNPKWALFPGFYFPKKYVKSNKTTLGNP